MDTFKILRVCQNFEVMTIFHRHSLHCNQNGISLA